MRHATKRHHHRIIRHEVCIDTVHDKDRINEVVVTKFGTYLRSREILGKYMSVLTLGGSLPTCLTIRR